MKLKCVIPFADTRGSGDYGQIFEMPDDAGREALKRVGNNNEPIFVELKPRACPKCGHQLEDTELEAATVSHQPRRRG